MRHDAAGTKEAGEYTSTAARWPDWTLICGFRAWMDGIAVITLCVYDCRGMG